MHDDINSHAKGQPTEVEVLRLTMCFIVRLDAFWLKVRCCKVDSLDARLELQQDPSAGTEEEKRVSRV
jgi:hypothetical protein